MKTPALLSSIRRKKRSEQSQLWLAQGFIIVFRAGARVFELFGPPKRRLRLQRLRENIQSIEQDKQRLLKQMRAGDIRGGLEAIDALQVRHAKPDEQKELQERISKSQDMWMESDALQSIAIQAGENKKLAVEGYREYVKQNPDSYSGHSYLGAFLNNIGEKNGSLCAYQDALRLAGDNTLRGSMAHLHIGEAYLNMGDIQAAICEFQHILDQPSSKTRTTVCMACLRLGDAYLKNADKHKAREAYQMAVQWDETKIIAKQAREKLKTL